MMGADNLVHATEETLEQYAMGKLEGEELDAFEDHLLICEHCETRLAEVDRFVQTFRMVAQRPPDRESHWKRFTAFTFRPPVLAAVSVAAALVIAVPMWRGQREQAHQTVQLSSFRSNEDAAVAKAGAAVDLYLEAPDLNGAPAYTVDVVDNSGAVRWSGQAMLAEGRIQARVSSSLDAGRYWVRLYSSSLKTELLREYSLTVK